MKKVTGIVLAAMLLSSYSFAASPATNLVNKVLNGQATITQTFPAVGGLTGYVVKANNGSSSAIVYADKAGRYVFIGNIINAQGQDLTQTYTSQYINVKLAGPAYAAASQAAWFSEGSDSAPHKLYVVMDPNCIVCHMLYQEVAPLVAKGQLQIRWIPVAFMRQDSAGKAAALLNAPNDAAASQLLAQNEANFNEQTEEGSMMPLAQNSGNPAVTNAFAKVAANTAFFTKFGFQGTPTLIYKKTDGTYNFVPGLLKGNDLQNMVNNLSSTW